MAYLQYPEEHPLSTIMNRTVFLKNFCLAALTGTAVLFQSCSKSDFTIKGEIEGADDRTVILERADFIGQWITLDSVHTNSKGAFKIDYPAPDSPEIYRLRVGDAFAYIPVDSTETVTLKANIKDFASSWSLQGSDQAEALSEFEKEYRSMVPHKTVPDSVKAFKRRVFNRFLQKADGSVVSYYILTKTDQTGTPLFNPSDRNDLKIFSAVATAFKEHRPDDPRTPLLENTVLNALRNNNSADGRKYVIEAEETGLLPIALPDETGKIVELRSVAGNGKPTILMFGIMASDASVKANHAIAALLRKRSGDMNVYSVSFDTDAGAWREAARNVPWATVLDHNSTSSAATDYNLTVLPCFYIIDRKGNLVERTYDPEQLEHLISSHS